MDGAPIVFAILAAGFSRRMGFSKALTPLGTRSPLARLASNAAGRALVIVTARELAAECAAVAPDARIAINERPELGMTSSLRVADSIAAADAYLAVFLADKPFVATETIAACESAALCGADVAYPVSPEGNRGHPVIFSPRARAGLRLLPDGDTLRALRDDPALDRAEVLCADAGAFFDLDTVEDWRAAEVRFGA
jgi:CTP:molybdopterin cytidylyltransferase MocA